MEKVKNCLRVLIQILKIRGITNSFKNKILQTSLLSKSLWLCTLWLTNVIKLCIPILRETSLHHKASQQENCTIERLFLQTDQGFHHQTLILKRASVTHRLTRLPSTCECAKKADASTLHNHPLLEKTVAAHQLCPVQKYSFSQVRSYPCVTYCI